MPYIHPRDRERLGNFIDPLLHSIDAGRMITAGELNYIISRILIAFVGDAYSRNYASINEAIGVLECAKLELYRRLAAPYEDGKIVMNGDIPYNDNQETGGDYEPATTTGNG